MKKNNTKAEGYIEILFEDRNKGYGAYLLRREYNRRLAKAFGISCAALILLLIGPLVIKYFQRDTLLNNEDFMFVTVNNAPIPKGYLTPEYIPPPPPQEKRNTAPLVVKDSVAPEKKEKEPKPVPDNLATTATKSKDTLKAKPATGNPDGDPNQVSIDVDEYPSWANSQYSSFQDYIARNTKVPEIDLVMRHSGTVIVVAMVHKDGTISDAKISKGLSPTLNAEAIRVIMSMPRLNPAIYHHKAVNIYAKFPVIYYPPSQATGGK